MYFLFENNNVTTNTNKNKLEIIKGTVKEKYQLILKKFIIKKYENTIENANEEMIIGMNKIKDSNIINLIIFDFSRPRILKTIFWYTFRFPITLTALEITISPIRITKPEINMLTINNLFRKLFVLFMYSDTLI